MQHVSTTSDEIRCSYSILHSKSTNWIFVLDISDVHDPIMLKISKLIMRLFSLDPFHQIDQSDRIEYFKLVLITDTQSNQQINYDFRHKYDDFHF